MADTFAGNGQNLQSPGYNHYAITPSDSVDFAFSFRGIYVGFGGDISLVANDGTAVLYKNAIAGFTIGMRGKRINVTGTTATNLIGQY